MVRFSLLCLVSTLRAEPGRITAVERCRLSYLFCAVVASLGFPCGVLLVFAEKRRLVHHASYRTCADGTPRRVADQLLDAPARTASRCPPPRRVLVDEVALCC